MALITVNNYAVISGSILLPRVGVWSADLVVDQVGTSTFTDGAQVTIDCGGIQLTGVVAPSRNGDFLDTKHVRVLGGAGGMAKPSSARAFVQPSAFVRDVVNGLIQDAGETISTSADQSLLNGNLTAWSVIADGTVSTALKTLLDIVAPTATWRITTDGKVFIGTDSYPSAAGDYTLIAANPKEGVYELGVESPWIVPGTSVDGVGQVARVEHTIEHNRIRSKVWVNLPEGDRGINAAIQALVTQAVAGIDYLAFYSAKVVSQSSDKATVDVQPDDTRLPGMSKVPLRFGIAGITVGLQAGDYVMVGWNGGDPSKPYCCNPSGTLMSLALTATGDVSVTSQTGNISVKATAGSVTVEATAGTTTVKGTSVSVEATGAATIKGASATKLGNVGAIPVLVQGTVDSLGVPVTQNPAASATTVLSG